MSDIAKFVHDENIKQFREKLKAATDPKQIALLEKLIEEEQERYAAAERPEAPQSRGSDARH